RNLKLTLTVFPGINPGEGMFYLELVDEDLAQQCLDEIISIEGIDRAGKAAATKSCIYVAYSTNSGLAEAIQIASRLQMKKVTRGLHSTPHGDRSMSNLGRLRRLPQDPK